MRWSNRCKWSVLTLGYLNSSHLVVFLGFVPLLYTSSRFVYSYVCKTKGSVWDQSLPISNSFPIHLGMRELKTGPVLQPVGPTTGPVPLVVVQFNLGLFSVCVTGPSSTSGIIAKADLSLRCPLSFCWFSALWWRDLIMSVSFPWPSWCCRFQSTKWMVHSYVVSNSGKSNMP